MNTEFEVRINHFYSITEIHFQNLVKYGEVPGSSHLLCKLCNCFYQRLFLLQYVFMLKKKKKSNSGGRIAYSQNIWFE